MIDAYIDVRLELFALEIAKQPDPERYVVEVSRDAADRQCEQAGAHLRTDRPPKFVVSQAIDVLTGAAVVLIASRWAVEMPDRGGDFVISNADLLGRRPKGPANAHQPDVHP